MRLKICAAVVLICSVLCAIDSSAQDQISRTKPSPQARHDAQALTVLSSSLANMGAGSLGAKVTTAQGTMTFWDGSIGTITIKSMGSDRVRHEIVKDGETRLFIVNQGQGHVESKGKKHKLPSWITQYRGPDHFPVFSRIADYMNPDMNVTYLGLEDLKGRQAHHIKIAAVPQNSTTAEIEEVVSVVHVFIDAQTLLVTKTQGFDFSPETPTNRSVAETYFDDYRLIGGVLVPYHVTRYVGSRKDLEITFQTISLNASLSEADFQ